MGRADQPTVHEVRSPLRRIRDCLPKVGNSFLLATLTGPQDATLLVQECALRRGSGKDETRVDRHAAGVAPQIITKGNVAADSGCHTRSEPRGEPGEKQDDEKTKQPFADALAEHQSRPVRAMPGSGRSAGGR